MASSRRRPRGSAINAAQLLVRIDPRMYRGIEDVSARLGISKAEFVEEMARHLLDSELDRHGTPHWWTRPLPATEQGELELDAS